MKDPALGRTRAERALGEDYPKRGVNTGASRVQEFRNINNGMFSGPRKTYGRYSVSSNALDALNRAKPRDNK